MTVRLPLRVEGFSLITRLGVLTLGLAIVGCTGYVVETATGAGRAEGGAGPEMVDPPSSSGEDVSTNPGGAASTDGGGGESTRDGEAAGPGASGSSSGAHVKGESGDASGATGSGGPGGGGAAGVAGQTGQPSAVVRVCAAAAAPYWTIGAAIEASVPGATIEVCPGIYTERLLIDGKPLHIVGVGGSAVTILDAGGGGSAVVVRRTGGAGVSLTGLTIRGGRTDSSGAGVLCDRSSLTLNSDVITANAADSGGGGLYSDGCVLDVAGTLFESNGGGDRGGGALLLDSSGVVRSSAFVLNEAANGAGLAVFGGSVAIRGDDMRANSAISRGGGLYHESAGPIEDNTIENNSAGRIGGGIYVGFHGPVVKGNTVSANTSANDGAGIYLHMGDAIIMENKIIRNRSGDDGGGVRIFTSRAHVVANLIEGNTAADAGGGIRVSHLPSMFIDNIIRNNKATRGGGLDLDNDSSVVMGGQIAGNEADRGAGINASLAPWSGALIDNVLISGNKAAWRGGGIALADNFQPIAMQRVTLIGNSAGHGGGIYASSTQFRIRNSSLSRNTASTNGGGIHVGAPESWTSPCPCPPTKSSVLLEFVALYRNSAMSGSAIWTGDTGDLSVQSSILFENRGASVRVANGAPASSWRYNDIMPVSFSGMQSPTGSNGNITADPFFVNAAGGDFHLGSASPAVNAGDPGELDWDGSRADMGIYGGPLAPLPAMVP